MTADELVALVEQAQQAGQEKVGGRGIERRLELPDVVFYPEVGQPSSGNDRLMLGSIIAAVLLVGVTIMLWSNGYERYGLIPVALIVGCVVLFFRGADAGTAEQFKRQNGIERHGLYLARTALFYLQHDRSLYVPRDRVIGLSARGQTMLWDLDYIDDQGTRRLFKVLDQDAASQPIVDAIKAWCAEP